MVDGRVYDSGEHAFHGEKYTALCDEPNQVYAHQTELSTTAPNEDVGEPNEPFDRSFETTFQGCEYSIWETLCSPKRRFWNVKKYVGKTFCKLFSSLLAQIE